MSVYKVLLGKLYTNLTLLTMGCLWIDGAEGGGQKDPIPKIFPTYPAMMALDTVVHYPKTTQKIYKPRDTPLGFCWHEHFSPKISKFCYTKKYRYRLHLKT